MGYGIEGSSFSSMQQQYQDAATGTMKSFNPGSTTKTTSKPGVTDTIGAVGGGALVGFQLAGPWGAAAGALVGLASTFF